MYHAGAKGVSWCPGRPWLAQGSLLPIYHENAKLDCVSQEEVRPLLARDHTLALNFCPCLPLRCFCDLAFNIAEKRLHTSGSRRADNASVRFLVPSQRTWALWMLQKRYHHASGEGRVAQKHPGEPRLRHPSPAYSHLPRRRRAHPSSEHALQRATMPLGRECRLSRLPLLP